MSDATAVARPVRLLRVPTDVLVRHRRHLEDLVHELQIMQAGADSGEVPPVPRLADLVSEILDAHSAVREVVWHQVERAHAAGREVVDIEVEVPPAAAGAAPQLVHLLDQADRMCVELQLLTMAAPPDVAELRRWMSAQIVAQMDRGEEPEPFRR